MELAKRYQQENISRKISPPRGSDGQGVDLDADDELPQNRKSYRQEVSRNMAINAEIDHEYQSPKKEEGKLLKLENQDGADYHT